MILQVSDISPLVVTFQTKDSWSAQSFLPQKSLHALAQSFLLFSEPSLLLTHCFWNKIDQNQTQNNIPVTIVWLLNQDLSSWVSLLTRTSRWTYCHAKSGAQPLNWCESHIGALKLFSRLRRCLFPWMQQNLVLKVPVFTLPQRQRDLPCWETEKYSVGAQSKSKPYEEKSKPFAVPSLYPAAGNSWHHHKQKARNKLKHLNLWTSTSRSTWTSTSREHRVTQDLVASPHYCWAFHC